jgi:hypothetical protein
MLSEKQLFYLGYFSSGHLVLIIQHVRYFSSDLANRKMLCLGTLTPEYKIS